MWRWQMCFFPVRSSFYSTTFRSRLVSRADFCITIPAGSSAETTGRAVPESVEIDNPVADPRPSSPSPRTLHRLDVTHDPHGVGRDGSFETNASLVFINRRLPVPKFTQSVVGGSATQQIIIDTGELRLSYTPGAAPLYGG